MKRFNVTGLCVPEKHYMADISRKLTEIVRMVNEGLYFTINRPRQYGKTTMFFMLSKALDMKRELCMVSLPKGMENLL